MENYSELLALIIGIVIYLGKQWLAKKNADLDKKAEKVQNVIIDAIVKAKSIQTEGIPKDELKRQAVQLISKEIVTNKKISEATKKLGIATNPEMIEEYVETGLHAAKLGLKNVLKENFKRSL